MFFNFLSIVNNLTGFFVDVQYGGNVKKIYLYQNVNLEAPPKRVVVTQRQGLNWKKMLDQVTEDMLPTTGYVRDIRTPVGGTVVRNFDQLKNDAAYVAVGSWESFSSPRTKNHQESPRPFLVGNQNSKYTASRYVRTSRTSKPYY